MPHFRTALRNGLSAALASDMPDVTWKRGYWRKSNPDQLPIGCVSLPATDTNGPAIGEVSRDSTVVVEVMASGGDDIEDDLDAWAVQLENTVLTWLDTVSDDYGLRREEIDVTSESGRVLGSVTMTFSAVIRTKENQPETIIRS